MLTTTIETLLLGVGPEMLTQVFLILLAVAFVVAVVLKKGNRAHSFTQYAPTLLTTLGILGTFAGIIAGLFAFDVGDIDNSIGGLLEGLKTAFVTSLAGMALSILYKLLVSTGWISPKQADLIDEDELGVADLYAVMREQVEGLEALRSSIGGDTDSSLVGQMKLLRSDVGDQQKALNKTLEPIPASLSELQMLATQQREAFGEFQDRLWVKLQDFADMMSKSATEQVINALKEVISDFNQNLVEQFGDNFAKLNEAVFELVQWQENYKHQLAQMGEQYEQGVQAITRTESAVSHISEETRSIPATMETLKEVLEVNQHQLAELQRHLEAFRDVRDRAVEAVPEIRSQINESVEGMKSATQVLTAGMTETTESLNVGLREAADNVAKSIADSGSVLTAGVAESTEAIKAAITEGSETFVLNSQTINETLKSTATTISDSSERTGQFLDDALSETNELLRGLVADLKADTTKLSESYSDASNSLVTETNEMKARFEAALADMRSQFTNDMQQLVEQQARENQRVLTGLSRHADDALRDTAESVQKQVKALDEALSHELSRVMSEMGKALAQISGRFTSDYESLVNSMANVVQMRPRG